MPRATKRAKVLEFAASRGWTGIGEAEWNELRQALPEISVATIREAGLPIDAPWCGIRQHTFEELSDSLRAFSAVYEARPDLQQFCREQVIAAKDHAKFVAIRSTVSPETRERKATMAEWMLVWLGDPSLFPVWAHARRAMSTTPPDTEPPPTP